MTSHDKTYGGPRAWKRDVKIAGPTALDKDPTAVNIPITVPWKSEQVYSLISFTKRDN